MSGQTHSGVAVPPLVGNEIVDLIGGGRNQATTAEIAALGGGSGAIHSSTKTASYTASLADNGGIVEFNSASSVNFTIPANIFPLNATIGVTQLGAGTVVVVGAGGVVFDTSTGVLASAGQFSTFYIRQRATNEWIPTGDFQTFTTVANYFVLSPTGSDANPGTFDQPFLTLRKAQSAMQATSGGTTTTYFRAGVYVQNNLSQPSVLLEPADSGTTWAGWPGDPYQSAIFQYGPTPSWVIFQLDNNADNITFTNFTLDGGAQGGVNQSAGAFQGQFNDNTTITHVHFQNNFFGPGVLFYDNNTFTFMFNECGPNEYQPLSMHNTSTTLQYGNYIIAGNYLHNYSRAGMELQCDNAGTGYWYNVHIDWNIFANFSSVSPDSNYGISFVSADQSQLDSRGNTIWGNAFNGIVSTMEVAIEIGTPNTTISDNTYSNIDFPFSISACGGSAIYNNVMSGYNTALNGEPYHQDGGYNVTEWIGSNTLSGTVTSGWPGSGNVYGAMPAVYAPSPQVTPV